MRANFCTMALLLTFAIATSAAQTNSNMQLPGDKMLADYFRAETARLAERCLKDVQTADDWNSQKAKYREQLQDMLGLSPMPEKTDLKAVVTGQVEEKDFIVEKVHFQSMPQLYVTANFYLPKNVVPGQKLPTILYLCGHSTVVSNGISLGNKTGYQRHGAWFARNGYACLVVDTLQLGEIRGIHHGTYREGMWWWNSRGYCPAGVEAWNSIRALDYLETRKEVDTSKFGVTGRSGGGAYSWVLTALDDRIKVAAPIAGITDLENYVVDGAVEGHCDCMFFVNTYRWDYPLLAALAVPRPLMLGNSDKDRIFPLNGIERLHARVKKIYELNNAATNLALLITEGPHEDTQDLQVPVFRWFNRKLKGEDPVISIPATNFFEARQLKVFDKLPEDQINTTIHDKFVPVAPREVPKSSEEWNTMREQWKKELRQKVFAGWPEQPPFDPPKLALSTRHEGLHLSVYDFPSQPEVQLRFYFLRPANMKIPHEVKVQIVDQKEWSQWAALLTRAFTNGLSGEAETIAASGAHDPGEFAALQKDLTKNGMGLLIFAPRGIGLSAWSGDERKQTHIRRRFMLLGQTLDSMRVWDIRRALQTARSIPETQAPMRLEASGTMAANVLYAAIFEPEISAVDLFTPPVSHRAGPDYLNVLRVLDMPQAAVLAADRIRVRLHKTTQPDWGFAIKTAAALDWRPDRLKVNPR